MNNEISPPHLLQFIKDKIEANNRLRPYADDYEKGYNEGANMAMEEVAKYCGLIESYGELLSHARTQSQTSP